MTHRAGQAFDVMASISNRELNSYDGVVAVVSDNSSMRTFASFYICTLTWSWALFTILNYFLRNPVGNVCAALTTNLLLYLLITRYVPSVFVFLNEALIRLVH